MQSDIENLLYLAEDHYLKQLEIQAFQICAASLAKRLEVYEYLRNHEIDIFQPIAAELSKVHAAEDPQLLEKALKHWLSIMRYCAMAMLLNNPEYFQRSVLEWLTEMVQAHQMQSLENTIYDLLFSQLKKLLSLEQFALIKPFLSQAQTTLLGEKILNTVGG
ncbi:globin family protein [Pleurocapsa sp. FMAR1]|uniref:phycobilisome protein n=1 Tax=Pleurocapsa sp. FMAR1 TaxID=3040204 RepID=UPI0029C919FA|nr:phycobilisome protein [Pleurocapsa sp. FMAR1]